MAWGQALFGGAEAVPRQERHTSPWILPDVSEAEVQTFVRARQSGSTSTAIGQKRKASTTSVTSSPKRTRRRSSEASGGPWMSGALQD